MPVNFQPVRQPYTRQNNFEKSVVTNKNLGFGSFKSTLKPGNHVELRLKEIESFAGEKLPEQLSTKLNSLLHNRVLKHIPIPSSNGNHRHHFVLGKAGLDKYGRPAITRVQIEKEQTGIKGVITKQTNVENVEAFGAKVIPTLDALAEKANSGRLIDRVI